MAGWKEMGPGTKSAVVAIIAILFGLGGYQIFGSKPGEKPEEASGAETAGAAATGAAATGAAATGAAAEEPVKPADEAAKADTTASTEAAAPAPAGSFDVVRVDPDGQTVVAGQVAPGARVSIRLDGVEVATATADQAGNFTALFGLGSGGAGRLMTMVATMSDGNEVTVGGSVAIAETKAATDTATASATDAAANTATATETASGIASGTDTGTTAVAVTEQGAKVLQSPDAGVAGNVTIETITYPAPETVQFGGKGAPGNRVQLYLDNVALGASVTIGADGSWNLTQDGIVPGIHTLRVDEMDATGKVVSRYETPFKRETVEALQAAASGAPSTGTAAGGTDAAEAPAEAPAEASAAQANAGDGAIDPAGAATDATATDATATDATATNSSAPAEGTDGAKTTVTTADTAADTTAAASETTKAETAPADGSSETAAAETGTATTETATTETGTTGEATTGEATTGAGTTQTGTAETATTGAATPATGTATDQTATDQTASDQATSAQTATEATSEAAKPPVSITVQPGYTLWGIASQQLGNGYLYVQIFKANADKIRDPNLIYPGQVFALPQP